MGCGTTCKECDDGLWSPDTVLLARNQLCKPGKNHTSGTIIDSNK
jgi:hypothetical protein